MAWLAGYGQRIKLTIDNIKIDTALSDFPVTIFFTSTQGEEIFTEFDADADYMKCAFTASDGTTQLYAECELFDHSEQEAIYHVKVTSVASGADTDVYYYYDNDHADNTTYIGAINTVAGGNVWKASVELAQHMVDKTTSTVEDSTDNSIDGTKTSVDNPIEAVGKIGRGQTFDGSDWIYMGIAGILNMGTDDWTVEAWIKTTDGTADLHGIVSKYWGYPLWFVELHTGGIRARIGFDGDNNVQTVTTGDIDDGEWHHIVVVFDRSANLTIYIDGDSAGDTDIGALDGMDITADANNRAQIGALLINNYYFTGSIDEVRVIRAAESAAYAKASYNSGNDSLLTYGSEEVKINALFFGTNF